MRVCRAKLLTLTDWQISCSSRNRIRIRKKSFRIHILHKLISRRNIKNTSKCEFAAQSSWGGDWLTDFMQYSRNRIQIMKKSFRINNTGVHWPNSLALLVVVFAQFLQLLNAIRLDRVHNLKNRVNHIFKSVLVPNFCSFFWKIQKKTSYYAFFRKNFLKFYQYSLPENLILVHFKRKKCQTLEKSTCLSCKQMQKGTIGCIQNTNK